MADFMHDEDVDDIDSSNKEIDIKGMSLEDEDDIKGDLEHDDVEESEEAVADSVEVMIDASKPLTVVYCPACGFPPEYCEYNGNQEFFMTKCVPWILENCKEVLSKPLLSKLLGVDLPEEEEKDEAKKRSKRGGSSTGPKKKILSAENAKVIIARVQRQKKKFVTVVAGLETVPDLKIKEAAKAFGKKFSSGASIAETASGAKEVTIQGDVLYDLPGFLVREFKVPPTAIFVLEDGKLSPCSG